MKEKTDEWFYFNQLQNGALIPETVQNCLLLKQLTHLMQYPIPTHTPPLVQWACPMTYTCPLTFSSFCGRQGDRK